MSINTKHMVRHFNRAASAYEQNNPTAHYCLQELVEQLAYFNIKPQVVLDLGSGTGLSSRALKKRYPKATIIEIDLAEQMLKAARPSFSRWRRKKNLQLLSDIHQLPLLDNGCDMLFANLALQWSPSPANLFKELFRVLKPGGILIFSCLGPDTFRELRGATQPLDGSQHVNDFIDIQGYGELLLESGFADPVLVADNKQQTFENLDQLLLQLRHSGVTNANDNRQKTLLGRQWLSRLAQNYESFRVEGRLPLSYELIFAHAWKAVPTAASGGGFGVPIDSIGKRA